MEIGTISTCARSSYPSKISTHVWFKIPREVLVTLKLSIKDIQINLKNTGADINVSTIYKTLRQ